MIDLLLPAAPKDYVKIPYVIESAAEFVPDVGRVCLITPGAQNYTKLHGLAVDCFTDAEVLPPWYDRAVIGWRPNWTTQQIIKLTQQVTSTDYWLTTDCDTFFNRKLTLFDGKPILYTGIDQFNPVYFSFINALFGFGKVYPQSFLSECTLYSRAIVDDMLTTAGGRDEFIRKTIEIINTGKGWPADSEIYGSFVVKRYPDTYTIRRLVSSLGGRYGSGEYLENDIIEARRKMRSMNVQTFSLHSWSETWN